MKEKGFCRRASSGKNGNGERTAKVGESFCRREREARRGNRARREREKKNGRREKGEATPRKSDTKKPMR